MDYIQKHQLKPSGEFNLYNTLEMRILKWYVAGEIIKDNFWIGVGTGDFQEQLNIGYEKIQFNNGIKFKYNAHNQYLESGIKFGVFGILILLFIFGQHLFIAYKKNNIFLLVVILYVAFSALTESIFARFHGTTFYALSVPLLYQLNKLKNEKK